MVDLLIGAIGGTLSVLIAHFSRRFTREILAAILVVAAVLYIVFAALAHAGTVWISVEVIGAVVYGGLAIAGMRGSLWWLAVAWALHPIWDIALHYLGPGQLFAPELYVIACVSWDWFVAGYLAFRATQVPIVLRSVPREHQLQ